VPSKKTLKQRGGATDGGHMKRARIQPNVLTENVLANVHESPNELLVHRVDGELHDNLTMLVDGKFRKIKLCL